MIETLAILIIGGFGVTFMVIVVTALNKVKRYLHKIKYWAEGHKYGFKIKPSDNASFSIHGRTNEKDWKIVQTTGKSPVWAMFGATGLSDLFFVADGVRTSKQFVVTGKALNNSNYIDCNNSILKEILCYDTRGVQLNSFGKLNRTDAQTEEIFDQTFTVFSDNPELATPLLDKDIQDIMVSDFQWFDKNDFVYLVLPDKIIVRMKSTNNFDEIQSLAKLGDRILTKI